MCIGFLTFFSVPLLFVPLIERFSEDLDLTLHFADTQTLPKLSRNARDALSDTLRQTVRETVATKVVPALSAAFQRDFARRPHLEILGEHGEQVRLHYPNTAGGLPPESPGYLSESVLLEFGGRNSAEPAEWKILTADLAEHFPQYTFPQPRVRTLDVLRTYWEKVTLIHFEACRTSDRASYGRMSRHLYDLMRLHQQGYTKQALERRDLLAEVVKVKTAFYAGGGVNYHECLEGIVALHFTPTRHKALAADHRPRMSGPPHPRSRAHRHPLPRACRRRRRARPQVARLRRPRRATPVRAPRVRRPGRACPPSMSGSAPPTFGPSLATSSYPP